jgi:hypothetical protein
VRDPESDSQHWWTRRGPGRPAGVTSPQRGWSGGRITGTRGRNETLRRALDRVRLPGPYRRLSFLRHHGRRLHVFQPEQKHFQLAVLFRGIRAFAASVVVKTGCFSKSKLTLATSTPNASNTMRSVDPGVASSVRYEATARSAPGGAVLAPIPNAAVAALFFRPV